MLSGKFLRPWRAVTLLDISVLKNFGRDSQPPADFLGHVEILIDAGIIKNACVKRNPDGEFEFWDFRGAFVTMQGHDLLDAMRNKELWQRVKSKSLHTGISLSWEFIKAAIHVVITEVLTQ